MLFYSILCKAGRLAHQTWMLGKLGRDTRVQWLGLPGARVR